MGFDLRKNERSNLDVLLQINNVRLCGAFMVAGTVG